MLLGITNVQQATAFDKAVKRTKKTGGNKPKTTIKKPSQTKDDANTAHTKNTKVASSSDTPSKTMDKPTRNNNNNKPTRKKNNNNKKKGVEYMEDSTFTYFLEHSLDGGTTFKKRQTLALKYSNKKPPEISFGEFEFDELSVKQFKELVLSDEYYRMRVVSASSASSASSSSSSSSSSSTSSSSSSSSHVCPMASVKACQLEASNFLEAFTFQVDAYANLIAMDYKTPLVTCAKQPKYPVSESSKFRSKARLSLGLEGKKPDLTRIIKEKNQGPPPKSFLQKYWLYILIGVVFMLTAGGGG